MSEIVKETASEELMERTEKSMLMEEGIKLSTFIISGPGAAKLFLVRLYYFLTKGESFNSSNRNNCYFRLAEFLYSLTTISKE